MTWVKPVRLKAVVACQGRLARQARWRGRGLRRSYRERPWFRFRV
ncbi:hypothetical protein GLE_4938 [Lysobacter enzymogenes]|uniref:Uncharacterized protein n=1 Tax=Lysobacter enzymogenes TaxID=69 RepID=A0A0S2DNP4_LYSEN|nr:hypothetical protein GLE_4938 [Lysobacter enzymogenes]